MNFGEKVEALMDECGFTRADLDALPEWVFNDDPGHLDEIDFLEVMDIRDAQ